MNIYLPSFSEVAEVAAGLGQGSTAPELWKDLIAWYPLNEGKGTAPRDLSKVRNHGAFLNAPAWSTGKVGRALTFNGTSDQVQSSDLPVYDCLPISVSAWFKTTQSAPQRGIFSHYVVASNNGWMLFTESGKVSFWYYAGANTRGILYNTLISPSAVNDGQWHHVHAVVFGAAGAELRVDGKLVDTAPWASTVSLPASAAPIRIGCYTESFGGYYFAGQIANCAAWNAAHTPSQAARLYVDPLAIGTLRRRVWPAAVAGPSAVEAAAAIAGDKSVVSAAASVEVDAVAAVRPDAAEATAAASVEITASATIGNQKAVAAMAAAAQAGAALAAVGDGATASAVASVDASATALIETDGPQAAAAASVEVTAAAAIVGPGSEAAVQTTLPPITAGCTIVGSGSTAAGQASVLVTAAAAIRPTRPSVARMVAAAIVAAEGHAVGPGAEAALQTSFGTIVPGPYRIEKLWAHQAGRRGLQLHQAGATAAYVHQAGAARLDPIQEQPQ